MWYGKIAIIMTLFSIGVSIGMYQVTTLYPNVINSPNVAWTQQHIKDMAGNYTSISNLNNGQNPNPALIFGDFIVGLTVVLNAIAVAGNAVFGGGPSSVLQGFPQIDITTTWLIQIIYGLSLGLLWVYIAANRSL